MVHPEDVIELDCAPSAGQAGGPDLVTTDRDVALSHLGFAPGEHRTIDVPGPLRAVRLDEYAVMHLEEKRERWDLEHVRFLPLLESTLRHPFEIWYGAGAKKREGEQPNYRFLSLYQLDAVNISHVVFYNPRCKRVVSSHRVAGWSQPCNAGPAFRSMRHMPQNDVNPECCHSGPRQNRSSAQARSCAAVRRHYNLRSTLSIVDSSQCEVASRRAVRAAEAFFLARLARIVGDLSALTEGDDEFDYFVPVRASRLHEVGQRIADLELEVQDRYEISLSAMPIPFAG